MITEEEATRLLKRADPARAAARAPIDDAAGYLAALRTRSTTMTIIDIEPATAPPPRSPSSRHRWLIAAAAAAAIAIVIGGLVIIERDDTPSEDVPADQPITVPEITVPEITVADPSAIDAAVLDVVMGFLDAYADFDADRALSYVADGALDSSVRPGDVGQTPELFRIELAVWEAFRHRETITGCEQVGISAAGVEIRCEFERHELGSEEVGLGPYTGNIWEFTVRDGKLTSVTSEWNYLRSSPERWEAFSQWVRANHPDEVLDLYVDDSMTRYTSNPETSALLTQRVDEFVADQLAAQELAPEFVAAWMAGDVEAAAAMLAPDFTWGDVAVDQLSTLYAWQQAVGTEFRPGECALGRRGIVECPYTVENDLTRFLDVGPIDDGFGFAVNGGAITDLHEATDFRLVDARSTFRDWVAENHPDDVTRMFDGDTPQPLLDATSIELWERYVDEFTATEVG